jgi:hypothetical protein
MPLASSAADPSKVAREPKAFVVQAAKLLRFPASQLGPSTKQRSQTVIANRPLHDEVVVVKCGEIGRQFLHRLCSHHSAQTRELDHELTCRSRRRTCEVAGVTLEGWPTTGNHGGGLRLLEGPTGGRHVRPPR